jgi:DNA-binding PadR family transcriptional regulator
MAGSRSIHPDRAAYLAEEEAKYLVRVERRARKRREAYERSSEGQQALREAAEAEALKAEAAVREQREAIAEVHRAFLAKEPRTPSLTNQHPKRPIISTRIP